MSSISDKVSYIRGLFDGCGLDPQTSKEALILSEIIGVLDQMAKKYEAVVDELDLLNDGIDAISDDLADVEEFCFGDEDAEDLDLEDTIEVECPNCQATLVLDESCFETGMIHCPNCDTDFSIDLSDEEDFPDEEL